jgi:GxxExxY protein
MEGELILNHKDLEDLEEKIDQLDVPPLVRNRWRYFAMNDEIETVASTIVDSAVKVRTALGPGLLESAYQRCMMHELQKRGLEMESEICLPIQYDGIQIESGFRIDLRVAGIIIVENKAVDQILPIHQAQLLTYLKLSGCSLGFLLNWKVKRIKDGIQRMVWGHE